MRRRKLRINGEEVTGTAVPFRIAEDGYVVLETEDGARLRLRTIVVNVLRTDQVTEDGEPVYVVQHGTQTLVDKLPDDLEPTNGDQG